LIKSIMIIACLLLFTKTYAFAESTPEEVANNWLEETEDRIMEEIEMEEKEFIRPKVKNEAKVYHFNPLTQGEAIMKENKTPKFKDFDLNKTGKHYFVTYNGEIRYKLMLDFNKEKNSYEFFMQVGPFDSSLHIEELPEYDIVFKIGRRNYYYNTEKESGFMLVQRPINSFFEKNIREVFPG